MWAEAVVRLAVCLTEAATCQREHDFTSIDTSVLQPFAANGANLWKLRGAGFADPEDFLQEARLYFRDKWPFPADVRDVTAWVRVRLVDWLQDQARKRARTQGVYGPFADVEVVGDASGERNPGRPVVRIPTELQETSAERRRVLREVLQEGSVRSRRALGSLRASDRAVLKAAYRQHMGCDEFAVLAEERGVSRMEEATELVGKFYATHQPRRADVSKTEERLGELLHKIASVRCRIDKTAERARALSEQGPVIVRHASGGPAVASEQTAAINERARAEKARLQAELDRLRNLERAYRQRQSTLHARLEEVKRINSKALAELFGCVPDAMDKRLNRAEGRLFAALQKDRAAHPELADSLPQKRPMKKTKEQACAKGGKRVEKRTKR